MDNYKFDDKEKESWIKRFVENFKRLLHLAENRGDKPINDTLAEAGESEEEKRLIREQCEEIDAFHANIKELERAKEEDSELTNGEWLYREVEKEMQDIAQKLESRALTAEELKELKKKIVGALDEEIAAEAKGLDEEFELIEKEVNKHNNGEE